jgi:hypothetical protein
MQSAARRDAYEFLSTLLWHGPARVDSLAARRVAHACRMCAARRRSRIAQWRRCRRTQRSTCNNTTCGTNRRHRHIARIGHCERGIVTWSFGERRCRIDHARLRVRQHFPANGHSNVVRQAVPRTPHREWRALRHARAHRGASHSAVGRLRASDGARRRALGDRSHQRSRPVRARTDHRSIVCRRAGARRRFGGQRAGDAGTRRCGTPLHGNRRLMLIVITREGKPEHVAN